MRVGEVARQGGVSVDAVRYYERLGLIRQSQRGPGGFREFAATAPDEVAQVRALQACGMTLAEIRGVVDGPEAGGHTCDEVGAALSSVIDTLDARIDELKAARERATSVREACSLGTCAHAHDPAAACT